MSTLRVNQITDEPGTGRPDFLNGLSVGTGYWSASTGQIFTPGDITAFSDARFKTDVQPIGDALDKLLLIHGVTFRRTDGETQTRHVGVLAQEVEAVLPEAVHTDAQGYKAVAYGNMVALLIEAIKELTARLEKLEG